MARKWRGLGFKSLSSKSILLVSIQLAPSAKKALHNTLFEEWTNSCYYLLLESLSYRLSLSRSCPICQGPSSDTASSMKSSLISCSSPNRGDLSCGYGVEFMKATNLGCKDILWGALEWFELCSTRKGKSGVWTWESEYLSGEWVNGGSWKTTVKEVKYILVFSLLEISLFIFLIFAPCPLYLNWHSKVKRGPIGSKKSVFQRTVLQAAKMRLLRELP